MPSTVNDSARALMAVLASTYKDTTGQIDTTGIADVYLFDAKANFSALVNGLMIRPRFHIENTGATTISVDALGSRKIRVIDGDGKRDITAGELLTNGIYTLIYRTDLDGGAGGWYCPDAVSSSTPADGSVATAMLSDGAVTTIKLADEAVNAAKIDGGDATAIRSAIGAISSSDVPSSIPVGTILSFAGSTLPTGFLKCNGAVFDAGTYADLNTVLGGNTLPDMRGEFLRGLDDGRGIDSGRTSGSSQGEDYKSHSHGPGSLKFTASTHTSGGNIYYSIPKTNSNGPINISMNSGSTSSAGGSETRPRNIAFLFIIKATA